MENKQENRMGNGGSGMNHTERSITANVVIRTTTDKFTSLIGEWRELTKDNIWNLLNARGSYDIEYISSDDNISTDTFIITERKLD